MTVPSPAQAERRRHRLLVARGEVLNHYQPIVSLCTGKVTGVEALGRLEQDGRVLSPATFLPSLTAQDLDALLFRSLHLGLEALEACRATHPALRLSLNVGPTVLTRDRFAQRLSAVLGRAGVDPGRITLEILEGEEFVDVAAAAAEIRVLRGQGMLVALDDVGSAYSSLMRLRELPVDVIKLDQAFVRGVSEKPDDLQFVVSMISLARGLRKALVVEGAETAPILNALRILGVDGAQGYAIARPMPAARLRDWLAAHEEVGAPHVPTSLLGVYAAHLMMMEACRTLSHHTMRLEWPESIHDPHACVIGHYLDHRRLHETPYGVAHKRFHTVITGCETTPAAWDEAAEAFRAALTAAIVRETVLEPAE
ncbi:MAG: EAL domain-containing protein [Janthinobacterium lividum]